MSGRELLKVHFCKYFVNISAVKILMASLTFPIIHLCKIKVTIAMKAH